MCINNEIQTQNNRFAVKEDVVVDHIPQAFLKVAWYFLRHGGDCEITGRRKVHFCRKSEDDEMNRLVKVFTN